jgi:hypothetical protein
VRIPLRDGGDKLIECAGVIGRVVGDCLEVRIPYGLAKAAHLAVGMRVAVGRRGSKLCILPRDPFEGATGPH